MIIRAIIATVLIAGFALFQGSGHGTTTHAPIPADLDRFPREIGRWSSVPIEIDTLTRKLLAYDTGVTLRFRGPQQQWPVDISVFYWDQYASDPSITYHTPEHCAEMHGWTVKLNEEQLVDIGTASPETIRRVVVEKQGVRMYVLYWYHVRGRVASTLAGQRWQLAKESAYHGVSDGMVVRLESRTPFLVDDGTGTLVPRAAVRPLLTQMGPALKAITSDPALSTPDPDPTAP